MVEVVQPFLTEVPRMVDRLERACVTRGCALLREVHTLASSSRTVGLLRVGQTAAGIELAMAIADPSDDRFSDLLDLLRASVIRLGEWDAARRASAVGIT
jgi:HPt (histidine-containing phosphotransfer) domain-containing protein